MVHEGFMVLNGRTVLVRTDNLEPRERANVSEFFETVRRLTANDGLAKTSGVIAGCFTAIAMLFIGFAIVTTIKMSEPATWSFFVKLLLSTAVSSSVVGTLCWTYRVGTERRLRAELVATIERLCAQSERCRIAASQLSAMSTYHAKFLEGCQWLAAKTTTAT